MDLINEFITVLLRENSVLEQLIEISTEKQKMIILGQTEELDKLVQKEGIVVSNLGKLEDARFQYQIKLAQGWKLQAEELSSARLIEKMTPTHPGLLPDLKHQLEHLQEALRKLKDINNENNELLKMSLDYIEEMQYLLGGEDAGTYSEKGLQSNPYQDRPSSSILDRKA
ncbi:MAG: flagellar protein FlgN [Bacillota bacterium]|nr:flagellar protein FlgN [Bacillota bacterium]